MYQAVLLGHLCSYMIVLGRARSNVSSIQLLKLSFAITRSASGRGLDFSLTVILFSRGSLDQQRDLMFNGWDKGITTVGAQEKGIRK